MSKCILRSPFRPGACTANTHSGKNGQAITARQPDETKQSPGFHQRTRLIQRALTLQGQAAWLDESRAHLADGHPLAANNLFGCRPRDARHGHAERAPVQHGQAVCSAAQRINQRHAQHIMQVVALASEQRMRLLQYHKHDVSRGRAWPLVACAPVCGHPLPGLTRVELHAQTSPGSRFMVFQMT